MDNTTPTIPQARGMYDTRTLALLNHLGRGGTWQYYCQFTEKKETRFFKVGTPIPIPQWSEVYFCVHPGKEKPKAGRGKIENVAAINCLFAEFDKKDGATKEMIEALDPAPSVIVFSGGGCHCYWLLQEPEIVTADNLEELKRVQAAWVERVGGDTNAKDLARVLRLPGSTNNKPEYGTPQPVSFIRAKFSPDKLYPLEYLVSFLPQAPIEGEGEEIRKEEPRPAPSSNPAPNVGKNGKGLTPPGEYFLNKYLAEARPGNRNHTGFILAGQLRDAGLSQTEAAPYMIQYAHGVPQPSGAEYTEVEALATLQSIYSQPARPAAQPGFGKPVYTADDTGINMDDWTNTPQIDPTNQAQAAGQAQSAPNQAQAAGQASLKPLAGKKRSTAEYVLLLSSLGFKFKHNMITQLTECNGNPMTDGMAARIRAKVRDAGVTDVVVVEDAYTADALENHSYHPIKDYLHNLAWDGDDHITDLADYFTDDNGVFPMFLKRWLIGAVARVMGGYQNRVLVLDGAQNIGKSQFVRWLASPNIEYFVEDRISTEDKDHVLRLMNSWIWEVSEFGSTTSKADIERLKAFLTTKNVRVRRAFGRYDTTGTAMCSFIGTANNQSGLLNDPTGSRRFMVTKLTKIDWDYSKKVDVDQVWAQAYALYLQGEPWDLTSDERKQAEDINENYQVIDIVEETIKKLFDIDPAQKSWRMPTVEILNVLKDPNAGNLRAGVEIDGKRMGSALTKLGLSMPAPTKINGVLCRGYIGIRSKP